MDIISVFDKIKKVLGAWVPAWGTVSDLYKITNSICSHTSGYNVSERRKDYLDLFRFQRMCTNTFICGASSFVMSQMASQSL